MTEDQSRERGILEGFSLLAGLFYNAVGDITKIKAISRVGTIPSVGFDVASKTFDDKHLSFDEWTDVGFSLAGGLAGVALAPALATAGVPLIVGGALLSGVGTLLSPRGKDVLQSMLDFSDLAVGETETLLDDAGFGRVTSTGGFRVDPSLPTATVIRATRQAISEGYKVPFDLGGAARDYPSSWSLPADVAFATRIDGRTTEPFTRVPFFKSSTRLGFGNVQGSTAAPSLGEPLSFPVGSPGYAPSAAQRSRALSRAASESSRF